MGNSVEDELDSSEHPGGITDNKITLAIAVVGMGAIAVGILGILLTDATMTDFSSIYPLLAVLGLACYVYLKARDRL